MNQKPFSRERTSQLHMDIDISQKVVPRGSIGRALLSRESCRLLNDKKRLQNRNLTSIIWKVYPTVHGPGGHGFYAARVFRTFHSLLCDANSYDTLIYIK